MRILCPIQYEIYGTTRTNRRPLRYLYKELVSVEIVEVSAADAPVAVEWMPSEVRLADREINPVVTGPDGKQLTRWFENRHWQRLSDGHFYGKKSLGHNIEVSHLQSMLADPSKNSVARGAIGLMSQVDRKERARIVDVKEDPRGRFETIRLDGRTIAMGYLDKAIEGLISVEGVLHRRCIEPFFRVSLVTEKERLQVRDIRVEATADALWSPSHYIFACFGVDQWDGAIAFANSQGCTFDISALSTQKPVILVDDSIRYDWEVSYKAATEAKKAQEQLRMFSMSFDPRLEDVIVSQDADEQYEILHSIDLTDPKWAGNESALRGYRKAMEILEDRKVTMVVPGHSGLRP
ncbi:hypothetical protein [Rhizobium sp. BK176]|uniref:hypothetical protein n=1 Tax=Rhizobium sp. BK176 TaxID=2587071 RepID=UPI00216A81E1|nr:hypothetical protein [Rhizobium sp. BK176]MCS4089133.1 hypothetical protein [Rhizobium sp. BK176]